MLTLPIQRDDVIDLAERLLPTFLAIAYAECEADPEDTPHAELAEVASRRAIAAARRFAQKARNFLADDDRQGNRRAA